MREAVIISSVRTPVGRCRGALATVPAHMLGAAVVREAVRRTKIDPERIDDVVFANLMNHGNQQHGPHGGARGRTADLGWRHDPDRQCASSLNALAFGAIADHGGLCRCDCCWRCGERQSPHLLVGEVRERLVGDAAALRRHPCQSRFDRQPVDGSHRGERGGALEHFSPGSRRFCRARVMLWPPPRGRRGASTTRSYRSRSAVPRVVRSWSSATNPFAPIAPSRRWRR